MHELTEQELYQALEYAKSIDEMTGREIIEQFQIDHPGLAETVFYLFPGFIAQENVEMSHLFMDLCFDILCVFQKGFGPLPSQNDMDCDWLEKQAVLLDTELQSLMTDRDMDEKIRARLQDRLQQRSIDETAQKGLVSFMNAAIDDYAAENSAVVPAIKTAQIMVFSVIRLFCNLYNQTEKTK